MHRERENDGENENYSPIRGQVREREKKFKKAGTTISRSQTCKQPLQSRNYVKSQSPYPIKILTE